MRWFAIASLLVCSLAASEATWYHWGCSWFWRCTYVYHPHSKDTATPPPKELPCSSDSDCGGGYCDRYLRRCKECKALRALCRRTENCCEGRVCEWGRCLEPKKPGKEGSQCKYDVDCDAGLCCAREHGRSICKALGSLGQSCYEPEGGLGYSVHHQCPCSQGLKCQTYRTHWLHALFFGVHRQCVRKVTVMATAEPTTDDVATAEPTTGNEANSTTQTPAIPTLQVFTTSVPAGILIDPPEPLEPEQRHAGGAPTVGDDSAQQRKEEKYRKQQQKKLKKKNKGAKAGGRTV